MTVFNKHNDGHKTSNYPLLLGKSLGLLDSINKPFPKIFDFYKQLKAQDWSEDEVDLSHSARDFENCDKSTYEIMVKTLMWQWEADSIARNILFLFSPFISDSELAWWFMKQAENEGLHALTYSEIVRQCLKDSNNTIQQILDDKEILDRSDIIVNIFDDFAKAGAVKTLNMCNSREFLIEIIIKSLFATLALEAIKFQASFACTFGVIEQSNQFVGVGTLVQKIMLDEILHNKTINYVLLELLKTDEFRDIFISIKDDIKQILDEVVDTEIKWCEYIFSEGRSIVGLNSELLKDYMLYNAQYIYRSYDIPFNYKLVVLNPLPWMENYINVKNIQTANQEAENANYLLNKTIDDTKGVIFDVEF